MRSKLLLCGVAGLAMVLSAITVAQCSHMRQAVVLHTKSALPSVRPTDTDEPRHVKLSRRGASGRITTSALCLEALAEG